VQEGNSTGFGFEPHEPLRRDARTRDWPLPSGRNPPDVGDAQSEVRMAHLGGLLAYLIGHACFEAARCALSVFGNDTRLLEICLFAAMGAETSINLQPDTINVDFLQDILRYGVSPNVHSWRTQSQGRKAWHLLLRSWLRMAWKDDFDPDPVISLSSQRPRLPDEDARIWPLAKAMLEAGAHIRGNCCVVAYETHDCRWRKCIKFSIRNIMWTCVPAEHTDELKSLIGEYTVHQDAQVPTKEQSLVQVVWKKLIAAAG
jgi:hypothetical protein